MSTRRRTPALMQPQPTGPNGRNMCLVCKVVECPPRRRTFCSPECAHIWNLRTNVGYVRQLVFDRDKGVCAICATDTITGTKLEYKLEPRWSSLTGKVGIGSARNTGHLWQADHIIPVVEGGGECGLENYRTLCTACHKTETAALRKRMAGARRNDARQPDLPLQAPTRADAS